MESTSTLRTLELLADGRDPATGLALPDASPYNQPAVVRSLFAAIRALESTPSPVQELRASRETQRAVPARSLPANAGRPWTPLEDESLCAAFDQGVAIKELAVQHGRSTTALNARLFKLGKIADPGIPLRHPVQPAGKQGKVPASRLAKASEATRSAASARQAAAS
jgi:hypothetical protein